MSEAILTDDTTPRPWALGPLEDRVYGPDGTDIAMMWAEDIPFKTDVANAALIVRAVNAYDEREALLREAAEQIYRIRHGSICTCADCVQADGLRYRISKALGETE